MEDIKTVHVVSRDSNWQRYRFDVYNKLAELYDLQIEVLTTGQLKPYIQDTQRVRYHLFRSWFPESWKPSFFPGALLSIIRHRPDAVLCLTNLSQLTELVALLLCRLLGIHFVWWTHAYDHLPSHSILPSNIKRFLLRSILRMADSVITFSALGRDYLVKHGFAADRVFYAPNTLDTESLLQLAEDCSSRYSRLQLLDELGIDKTSKIALFSGRLLADKRVDEAIKIIEQIQVKHPHVHLLVVGDGIERENLERLANERIPDRVTFFGSLFEPEKLAKLFTVADVFLMPGYVGLAIVHAFCFGLPLLTSKVNHSPEIQYLHEGENGYLLDVGDIDAFVERISELLVDSDKLAAMSHNALQTVHNEADIKIMIHQMATALNVLPLDENDSVTVNVADQGPATSENFLN